MNSASLTEAPYSMVQPPAHPHATLWTRPTVQLLPSTPLPPQHTLCENASSGVISIHLEMARASMGFTLHVHSN